MRYVLLLALLIASAVFVGCGESKPNPYVVGNEVMEGKKLSVTWMGATQGGNTHYAIVELENNGKKHTFLQAVRSSSTGEAISLVEIKGQD